jgi:hypothetical protein
MTVLDIMVPTVAMSDMTEKYETVGVIFIV